MDTRVRRKLLTIAGICIAIPIAVIAVALAYLQFADLSGHRGLVERLASRVLGRELRIAGDFAPDVGLTTRLVATDVTLANPPWTLEPTMAAVERIDLSLELLPLLVGKVRIPELTLDRARVWLESDAEGRASWRFDAGPDDNQPSRRAPDITLGTVAVTRLAVALRAPSLPRPLDLEASRLDLSTDVLGMLDLRLEGAVNGRPLALAGVVGPIGGAAPAGSAENHLEGHLGNVAFSLRATVDDLSTLSGARLAVGIHGPDASDVTETFGLPSLGDGSFDITAHLAPSDRGHAMSLSARLGQVSAEAASTIDSLQAPRSIEATVTASGPDLAAAGALAGLGRLPARPFRLSGGVRWNGSRIAVDDLELRVDDAVVTADGVIGAPPAMLGTDFRFDASGPDLDMVACLTGLDLPPGAFTIRGRLERVDRGVVLEGVAARVGEHTAAAEGTIATTAGLAGSDLRLTASGPDLSWLTSTDGAADEPYTIEGRFRIRDDKVLRGQVAGRLGDIALAVEGLTGPPPSLATIDATVHLAGPEASRLATLIGVAGFPAEPFQLDGRVRVRDHGFDLDAVEARVGAATLKASGRLGSVPGLVGSDLDLEARIPSLAPFNALVPQVTLPKVPASASGHLAVAATGIRLEGAVLDVDGTRVAATGTLAKSPNLAGSDVELELASLDLAATARLVAATGLVTPPELPARPLTLAGRVVVDDLGYQVEGVRLALGDATASCQGRLGRPPDLHGSDLAIEGGGPDASLLAGFLGVTLPVLPFRFQGRVERPDGAFRFHDLHVQLGDCSASANGTLGEPPRLDGTDLELQASGASLALIVELAGVDGLPDLPFELRGRFIGNPRRLRTDRLSVRLGTSDAAGSVRLDREGPRPRLEAELASRRVDLYEILGGPVPPRTAEGESLPGTPAVADDGLVLSDEPIAFDGLNKMDGEFRWAVDALELRTTSYTAVDIGVRLENGTLHVDPMRAVGANGGKLDGMVELESGRSTPTLRTAFRLNGVRIDLTSAEEDPAEWPTIDLDVALDAEGRSLHDLAGSASGRIAVVVGPGLMDGSILDLLGVDIVGKTVELLNPFSGGHQTTLRCGVIAISLDDGLATLDPFALQTDRNTVVGSGTLDLSTEALDLEWVAKLRRGIGISTSTITNAYLKLGGTLADPKIESKPLEALTTTGVAVATGGLSLLARGLLDRITAEAKVCEEALARAGQTNPER